MGKKVNIICINNVRGSGMLSFTIGGRYEYKRNSKTNSFIHISDDFGNDTLFTLDHCSSNNNEQLFITEVELRRNKLKRLNVI